MTVQVIDAPQAPWRRSTPFSAVIDARSPSEYAEDHLPGAVNWSSRRRRTHTIGVEVQADLAFEAQKRSAALVARNIAPTIERQVMDQPKTWRPLVTAGAAAKRSGSLAWFLDQMGFRTHVLEGGYKGVFAAR